MCFETMCLCAARELICLCNLYFASVLHPFCWLLSQLVSGCTCADILYMSMNMAFIDRMSAYIHKCMHACMNTYIHTTCTLHMHAGANSHIHAYIHTHTHTH
jgi:hypothetical protein